MNKQKLKLIYIYIFRRCPGAWNGLLAWFSRPDNHQEDFWLDNYPEDTLHKMKLVLYQKSRSWSEKTHDWAVFIWKQPFAFLFGNHDFPKGRETQNLSAWSSGIKVPQSVMVWRASLKVKSAWTSFLLSSRTQHLPTQPKVLKPRLRTMVSLCLID